MGWRRSGGLGCVFLFFLFFFVFLRLSTKSSKNLEKTKKNKKKQKNKKKLKKKNKKKQTHGMEKIWGVGVCFFGFFGFFWFFWFFWFTLADIVRRKGADGVRLSVSVWLQFGIECTKCVKMMVFTHCQGRPFCFFCCFVFCFFISKQKRLVSSRPSPP